MSIAMFFSKLEICIALFNETSHFLLFLWRVVRGKMAMEEIGKRRMGEEKRDAFYSLFYSQKNIHFSSFPSHFPSLAIKKHQIYSLHAHYFTAWLRKLRHEMEGESSSHCFKGQPLASQRSRLACSLV